MALDGTRAHGRRAAEPKQFSTLFRRKHKTSQDEALAGKSDHQGSTCPGGCTAVLGSLGSAPQAAPGFVKRTPSDQLFQGVPSGGQRYAGAQEDEGKASEPLQDIAYSLALQNRAHEESLNAARGTPASLTRADEVATLTARGLDRFNVQLCAGEWGD